MDEIEQRKETVKKFLKERKSWIQYGILALIILLSIYVRSQDINHLQDPTTGKYISLELDSTIWLRYAQYITEHGTLPDVDHTRFVPLGRDLSTLGTFTSYFIAYLYKFLHIFIPSITIEYTDIIYPIIATAVMLVFFFLLIQRLLDWKIAAVSTLFLAVLPSFIFRSMGGSSDHDILGMMFIIIAFYFFTTAWQSKTTTKIVLFGILAGGATIFARLTAGSSNLIFTLFGIFVLIEVFLNRFDKLSYYAYLSWIVPVIIFFSIVNKFGGIIGLMTVTLTSVAFLALGIATVEFFLFKKDIFKVKHKLTFLPEGVISAVITVVLAVLLMTIISPSFVMQKTADAYQLFFHAYEDTRWTITVAENRKTSVQDWAGNMGSQAYVIAMMIGAVILFYRMTRELRQRKVITGVFTFFLIGYVFSRYSNSGILNGESTISKFLFISSLIVFFGTIIYGYLSYFKKNKTEYEKIEKLSQSDVFLLLWFLILVIAATSAIRLLFEFSPISTIFAAIAFVSIAEYFYNRKEQIVKVGGIILVGLILFNPIEVGPFSKGIILNDFQTSFNEVAYSGPGYNQQWQIAGQWARTNTPKEAVFSHWWDYGYWVQSGFERATVGDGGNSIGWWNYLMARKVLTAQNNTEPLGFLYAHNVTYFLAVSDDIGKYPAYSSIGGDQNYDRYSWIQTFTLNPQGTQEKRNSTVLFYQGNFGFDEDINIDGVVYPKGQAGVGAVLMPVNKKEGNSPMDIEIQQPIAMVVNQGKQIELPMRCVFYNNKLYEFTNYKIDSCFRLLPVFLNQNQANPFGAGLYLSRRTSHSLFARLYLMNEENEYFKSAYDDSGSIPLSIYQGRLVGPIKIWQVVYPKGFSITQDEYNYYTVTEYPDQSLQKI